MFKHYFNAALRHLARHKATTIVNVLCLALGLATFAISYGLNGYFDRADWFHEKAERTYVLTQRTEYGGSLSGGTLPLSGWGVAQHLKADYPELETVARAMHLPEDVAIATDSKKDYVPVAYADPEFLEVFDFQFTAGDRRTALRAPHSAVISEELSKKLFDSTNVLGQPLLLSNRTTVHISGVMASPRQPSHISTKRTPWAGMLQFSLLVSSDTYDALVDASKKSMSAPRLFDSLAFTYVVLPQSGSITLDRLRSDLGHFAERHVPAEQGHVTFDLRPLPAIFQVLGDFLMKTEKTGISNSAITFLEGLLLLIVACLNYANLASAQATTRLKETALRRVVGANRLQVLLQSFVEALLVVVLAACLALAILPTFVKGVERGMWLDVSSLLFTSVNFWLWIAGVIIVVAFMASLYPAFVASRIRPAHALQSGRAPITKRRLMSALVIFQFATASFLFIATGVMSAQSKNLHRMATAGSDPIVVIANNLKEIDVDAEALKTELGRRAAITSVTAVNVVPGKIVGPTAIVRSGQDPASRSWLSTAPAIDYDFFKTMSIQFIAGRDFASDISDDASKNVVIDRALSAEYGWSNPQEAIGKQIYLPSSAAKRAPSVGKTVIGVVENDALYPVSLMGHSSMLYTLDPSRATSLLVRISKDDVTGGLAAIDAAWNRVALNVPLRRGFVDEQFELVYNQLTAMGRLIRVLAWFSILIGAMGLVGIATHAMAQRQFEIGVRRTLGASVRELLVMLLKDFSKPIVIANLIAWPFAFIFALGYSTAFAQRESLNVLPYISSLVVGLIVSWIAVLRQASRTARVNPAAVLRHE